MQSVLEIKKDPDAGKTRHPGKIKVELISQYPNTPDSDGTIKWTWRESNPRPKVYPLRHLPSQSFF